MKNLFAIILLAVLTLNSWAAIPEKKATDILQIGLGANGQDKEFIFNTGDGVNNPKILVDDATKAFTLNGDTNIVETDLTLGKAINEDLNVTFDIGNGGTNPKFKWDSVQNAITFSNDGTLFKKIGSGAGGDAGLNNLDNPGFDDGITVNWSCTATKCTEVAGIDGSEKSLQFDPTAQNDEFKSDLKAIPDALKGNACEARVYYIGGDENLRAEVLDGNGAIVQNGSAFIDLKPHATAGFESIFFQCPTATEIAGDAQKGNLQLRVYNNTASIAVSSTFDRMHNGELIGLFETQLPDVFSAIVTESATVYTVFSENAKFINTPTCSYGGVGRVTCPFVSGIFTNSPSCQCTVRTTNGSATCSISASAAQAVVDIEVDGVAQDASFDFSCTKQGVDAKQSVQVYKSIPRVADNINDFNSNVTNSQNVTNENTDWINGNCSINGNFIDCPIVSGVFDSPPNCNADAFNSGSTNFCKVIQSSTSLVQVACRNTTSDSSVTNEGFALTCGRGSDYRTPVVQPVVIPNAVFYGPYDLTVSGTNWTTSIATGKFYTVNGNWYADVFIEGDLSAATTSLSLTIGGVAFGGITRNPMGSYVRSGSTLKTDAIAVARDTNLIVITDTTSFDKGSVNGTVQLSSKPTLYVPQ